jgi:DNA-binding response OmpR family regulator
MAKILIVDDDPDILRLLEFSLQRTGHTVLISKDGIQGLDQVDREQPDLIVADVMMPNMTGYDFCRQVRAKPEAQETPIIVFSARFQPVDKQTALQAGATDYLPKTHSPDALVARIQELLPATAATVTTKSIGFFSLRGGSGVTSLAINTALALAGTQKREIAVVDLAKMGGHAALLLGLRPSSSIARILATVREGITLEAIKPHLIQHQTGIQLLASAPAYDQQLPFTDDLSRLVRILKSEFSFTVFDIAGSTLNSSLTGILTHLDKIGLILTPDMPSLQSTAIALQGLTRLGVPESKVVLIVNQVMAQGNLPLEILQKAVKRPIGATIPFEPEMIKAVNRGRPLLLSSPKSAGAAAIAKLAETLTH